jgi:transposase-like protein
VPRYSDERKEAVLRKMLPPHNRPRAELAAEEGISEATLYNWRHAARDQGRLLPERPPGGPTGKPRLYSDSPHATIKPCPPVR